MVFDNLPITEALGQIKFTDSDGCATTKSATENIIIDTQKLKTLTQGNIHEFKTFTLSACIYTYAGFTTKEEVAAGIVNTMLSLNNVYPEMSFLTFEEYLKTKSEKLKTPLEDHKLQRLVDCMALFPEHIMELARQEALEEEDQPLSGLTPDVNMTSYQ